jgi:Asp-tRNAAsn/Glu-tRNAGln amidotransferase A subunit and related amidases
MYKSALKLSKKINKNKIEPINFIKEQLEKAKNSDAFVLTYEHEYTEKKVKELLSKKEKSPLAFVPVCVDDTIMIKGTDTEAGSKSLKGFKAPFSATVYKKINNAGMIILGKTAVDEFSIAPIENDLPDEKLGAIDSIKEGITLLGFTNDFSGKYRREAFKKGLYYIKPTYGTVSRFGLVATVSSMDQIGIVSKTTGDGFAALEAIAGYDENDVAMYEPAKYKFETDKKDLKGFKIGVPLNIVNLLKSKEKEAVLNYINQIKNQGAEVCAFDFDLGLLKVLPAVKYILSAAEISNNTNRFDGAKFGYRTENFKDLNDLYLNSRTEGFGLNGKLASIMGCMVLSSEHYEASYFKSMKIRRVLKNLLDDILNKYDALIMPLKSKNTTEFTSVSTLTGVPSLTIPLNGGAAGIEILTGNFKENILLNIGKYYEESLQKEEK